MFSFYSILFYSRRWVYGWNSNTTILVFDYDASDLLEFSLVFINLNLIQWAGYTEEFRALWLRKSIVIEEKEQSWMILYRQHILFKTELRNISEKNRKESRNLYSIYYFSKGVWYDTINEAMGSPHKVQY